MLIKNMAPGADDGESPGPKQTEQSCTFAPNTKYTIPVNKIATTDELSSETKALFLLRELGYLGIQQLDWIAKKDGEWVIFEIKEKDLWTPGDNFPHWATGLDISQLKLRTRIQEELGFRTYLLTFQKGTNNVYGAYLDELEAQGGYHDTPARIRLYPVSCFT